MVKVFTTNEKGKIEFTKRELEELLNEVWNDGYCSNTHKYWWYSPTITTTTGTPVRLGTYTVSTGSITATDGKVTFTTGTE